MRAPTSKYEKNTYKKKTDDSYYAPPTHELEMSEKRVNQSKNNAEGAGNLSLHRTP